MAQQTGDRHIQSNVYSMKMRRPTLVDLYKIASHSVDVESGVKTTTETRARIQRGIVFPSKIESVFSFDIAYLAASRDFTSGGLYGKQSRTVILDTRDLPSDWGKINSEQWVIIAGRRYDVKHASDLNGHAWQLLVIETEGAEVSIGSEAHSGLILVDSATGTI